MFIVNSQIFCVQSSIRAAKGNKPLLLLLYLCLSAGCFYSLFMWRMNVGLLVYKCSSPCSCLLKIHEIPHDEVNLRGTAHDASRPANWSTELYRLLIVPLMAHHTHRIIKQRGWRPVSLWGFWRVLPLLYWSMMTQYVCQSSLRLAAVPLSVSEWFSSAAV